MNYPYKEGWWETKDHKKIENKRYGNLTHREHNKILKKKS